MKTKISLTNRQKQMLICIAEGGTCKDFANKYNISVHTAEAIRYQLVRDMGFYNIALLTHYAIEQGLVKVKTLEEIRAIL